MFYTFNRRKDLLRRLFLIFFFVPEILQQLKGRQVDRFPTTLIHSDKLMFLLDGINTLQCGNTFYLYPFGHCYVKKKKKRSQPRTSWKTT